MKTMAEVIMNHPWLPDHEGLYTGLCPSCPGVKIDGGHNSPSHAAHIADALAAAGYGPVREAAAAGVRSVVDIWAGGGGRRTVRIAELDDAARTVLDGEWDDHIKWNMGDIRREQERRARTAALAASRVEATTT